MMKKIVLSIFLCLFHFCGFSTENTIYAVGDAKTAKEKLAIENYSGFDSGLSSDLKNVMEETRKVVLSDFSYYRKIFDTTLLTLTTPLETLEKEYQFIVRPRVMKQARQSVTVQWTLYDTREKKNLLEKTIDLTAKNVRQLTHQLDNEIYAILTKKPGIFESKIVFVGDEDDTPGTQTRELYIMDFDGGNVRKLTDHQSNVISPTMSWDKKKIAYSVIKKHKGIKNIDLFIYDLETNEEKLISSLPGINSGAVFLKDNQNILLTLSYQGNAEIYKMNIKDKDLSKMTSHFSDDVDPHLSPDGKTLAFVSGRSGKAHIYLMDASYPEKDVRRISYVGLVNATPRFSPTRNELVFASWVDNVFDIFRIDLKGNELTRLTKNFGNNENPSYSPDGEFILFSSERVISQKKISKKLYIMDRDGDVMGAVTENLVNAHTPWWSP